ncbi:hypothetical protein [Sphingomonas antarctica]|uniref:hypothetical protein n=1 Tax=Sphingomonas antarctica TaxID=2040274 RepID=UPI0039EC8756
MFDTLVGLGLAFMRVVARHQSPISRSALLEMALGIAALLGLCWSFGGTLHKLAVAIATRGGIGGHNGHRQDGGDGNKAKHNRSPMIRSEKMLARFDRCKCGRIVLNFAIASILTGSLDGWRNDL